MERTGEMRLAGYKIKAYDLLRQIQPLGDEPNQKQRMRIEQVPRDRSTQLYHKFGISCV